jgi:hypothetical protein
MQNPPETPKGRSKEGANAFPPPPPSSPPFAGWLREPLVALACEAAASAFLSLKKKKKAKETAKVSAERDLQSLASPDPLSLPLRSLAPGLDLSSLGRGCLYYIFLTPFLSDSFFHSPCLTGSLSVRLPRSLARSESAGRPHCGRLFNGTPSPTRSPGPASPPTPRCCSKRLRPHSPSSYLLLPPTP